MPVVGTPVGNLGRLFGGKHFDHAAGPHLWLVIRERIADFAKRFSILVPALEATGA